jgi:hypothetical protein
MNDAAAVGCGERRGNRNQQIDGEPGRQPRACLVAPHQGLQRLAGDIFHHEQQGSGFLFDGMDGRDIGMVQRRRRPRLLKEALPLGGVLRYRLAHDLDRNLATQPTVLGKIDHTHTTASKLAENAVVS